MKRVLFTILLTCLVFSLGACDDQSKSTNTLSEAELTEREMGILSATTDKYFVFDFNVNSTYKQVSVWIEKFELGKLVEDKVAHLNTDITESGQIIFSSLESYHSENQSMFNISVTDEGGTSRMSPTEKLIEDTSSIWGTNPVENIPITGEIALASIAFSKETNMSSLSTDFYSDVDAHMDEIKDYDVVYILKSEFTK